MRKFADGQINRLPKRHDVTVPSTIHPSLNIIDGFIGRNLETDVPEVRTITAIHESPGTPSFLLDIRCNVRRFDGKVGRADIVSVAGSTATGRMVQIIFESVPPRNPADGPEGYFDLIPQAVDGYLALRNNLEAPETPRQAE